MINKIEYPTIVLPSDGWLIIKDERGQASMMFCGNKSSSIYITFIENASVYASSDILLTADKYLKPQSYHKS